MTKEYSDYIIYVDESGDHSLTSIDQEYPIFVLAFCVFKKDNYLKSVDRVQSFKFAHFGHDIIILHENDIRRDRGVFSKLKTKTLKDSFMTELSDIIEKEEFTIIVEVIDKEKLDKKNTENPYHLAMRSCLERLYEFLLKNGEGDKQTHIVFEQRGKQEDKDLELEFRRICDGNNYLKKPLDFKIVLANKQSNSTGLQLADLVARPVGVNYLRPDQDNRAFQVIKNKLEIRD
ncbi:MAG: DUF3800 domain-containing protein [Methylococcales symbiont of Hymedesmia sp. n. MRB-2018]|nr:MAG: DUF3800 domain-containing protein [Methylococcales symbiont of Hymedesmia sp. n. MRB-2018]